jgi:uncharacterized C2H2 Zn-finger protein
VIIDAVQTHQPVETEGLAPYEFICNYLLNAYEGIGAGAVRSPVRGRPLGASECRADYRIRGFGELQEGSASKFSAMIPSVLPANFPMEESYHRRLYIASITSRERQKLSWLIVFVKCERCEMTFRNGEDLKRHRIAHEPDDSGA